VIKRKGKTTGECTGKEVEMLSPTEGDIFKKMIQNFIFTAKILLWQWTTIVFG
jgi:hypothetical protein